MSTSEATEQSIPQIRMIEIARISPESQVNSRRTGIEENAKRLQASIEQHGFRPEHPVLLRPFPDATDEYDWEPVSGRSRVMGAKLAGQNQVPAIVEEMDDEKAHLLSFKENEARENLSPSDKTYWYEKKYKSLRENGYTTSQAREMTAKFYGYGPQQIQTYLLLATLPATVIEDVDHQLLTLDTAKAIAQRYAGLPEEEQEAAMTEAARWCKQVPNEQRSFRNRSITKSKNSGTFQDLEEALREMMNEGQTSLNVQIAPSMRARLEQFTERKGYPSIEAALPMLLAQMMEDAGIE